MKIGIVTTHSYPIPTPVHTGDIVILDMAQALDDLGHDVTLYSPAGTRATANGKVLPMPCSNGGSHPMPRDCERGCWDAHRDSLMAEDVVHDFSITKYVVESMCREGRTNFVCTPMGGVWTHPERAINFVVWSEAMRQRALRGGSDYEASPDIGMDGPPMRAIADAHVVPGGIDTDWYTPTYKKEGFYLWINRWHKAKGYHVAIELARFTGIDLVMAGEHPDREVSPYQRECALDAEKLAAGLPNVRFEWLPGDPDHHDAKRDLYRSAKALLYTVQFQEPFGLSRAEALACGTPVLGTRYGSVPEVVDDGVTGVVCGDSVDELASSLGRLDSVDPKACREAAVKRYDRHVMAKNYLREYALVMNGKVWG